MKWRDGGGGASEALDVLCLGEALWDLTAPRGQTFAAAPSLRFEPGGAAVNVALALAKRGWKAGLAAVVGADALGEALAARVAARGVSTALVERAPPRTGLAFLEQPGGAPRVVGYRHAGELPPSLPARWRARVLVLTGLQPAEAHGARLAAAARTARRRGAWVVVDLNARPRLWRGHAAAPPPAWLNDAHVVKASEDDLTAMGTDRDALRAVLRRSAVLFVTAGPRAARASGPFGQVVGTPVPVGGCAVGAGDAFVAGVCDALLAAKPGSPTDAGFWDRALRLGHAFGRRQVARGARSSGWADPDR